MSRYINILIIFGLFIIVHTIFRTSSKSNLNPFSIQISKYYWPNNVSIVDIINAGSDIVGFRSVHILETMLIIIMVLYLREKVKFCINVCVGSTFSAEVKCLCCNNQKGKKA